MKFEITSFVAACVVYLVRLRVQYVSHTRPVYSSSYLENRSHLYIQDLAASQTQPEQEPRASAEQSGSGCSKGMGNTAGFVHGCSRAV